MGIEKSSNNPIGNHDFNPINRDQENHTESKATSIAQRLFSIISYVTPNPIKNLLNRIKKGISSLRALGSFKTQTVTTPYFSSNAQKTKLHDPTKAQVDQQILDVINNKGVEMYSAIVKQIQKDPSLIQKTIGQSYGPKHKIIATHSKESFEITEQFQIDQKRQGYNITLNIPDQQMIIERSDDYVDSHFHQAVAENWDQRKNFVVDLLDKNAQTYVTNGKFYFIDKQQLKSIVAQNYPFSVAKQLEKAFGKEWGYVAQVVGTQTLYNSTVGYIAPIISAFALSKMSNQYRPNAYPYSLNPEYSATITPVYKDNGKDIEKLEVTIHMNLDQVDNASNQVTRSVSTAFKCELIKNNDQTPIFHAIGFGPLSIKHFV
jgi:hypothetical protein